MNESGGPRRLQTAVAAGSALAAGLSEARTRGPSDAQLQALEAALAASLGAAAAGAGMTVAAGNGGASTPAQAPLLASAGAVKIAVVLVALAAGAAGISLIRSSRHVDPATAGDRSVATGLPAPWAAPTELPAQADSPAPAAAPSASPWTLAPPAPVRLARTGAHAARPRRAAGAADQLALIARAQRALLEDPSAALALVEDNRRALAQSAFAQEAEVIAVAALVRLGRPDDARARAEHFLVLFPDSVHGARMRRLAGIIN